MDISQHLCCAGTIYRTICRNILGKKFEDEVAFLNMFISGGDTCFDIGAAEGRYTFAVARLASPGTVFSFEPGTYSRRVLSAAIRFHRLKNAVIVPRALGNAEGRASFLVPQKKRWNFGYSLAHLAPARGDAPAGCLTEEVAVTTLDRFCAEEKVQAADFIKCDVEGAEFLVLEGSLTTIRSHLPTILCELDREFMKRYGHTPEHVRDLLLSAGYRMFALRPGLVHVPSIDRAGNYFFVHPRRTRIPPDSA
jgi:FkbM family methyltransferase